MGEGMKRDHQKLHCFQDQRKWQAQLHYFLTLAHLVKKQASGSIVYEFLKFSKM
jgi:hypothetical protein